jgi:hypothetical protein
MLANVMLTGLYAFLIFWALQAAYVLWQAYRNNALPSFDRRQRHSGGFVLKAEPSRRSRVPRTNVTMTAPATRDQGARLG